MKIFDYLDRMKEDLSENDWEELGIKYRELAEELCGKDIAKKIARVSVKKYEKSLLEGLAKATDLAEDISARAIYFKYDIDDNWHGIFYICPDYNPAEIENDDWIYDWEREIKGPDMSKFAKLYQECRKMDCEKTKNGATLYLIARTISAFGKCVDQSVPRKLAICIGFHDQEQIWRMQDEEAE
jgi:hypothetical protein